MEIDIEMNFGVLIIRYNFNLQGKFKQVVSKYNEFMNLDSCLLSALLNTPENTKSTMIPVVMKKRSRIVFTSGSSKQQNTSDNSGERQFIFLENI